MFFKSCSLWTLSKDSFHCCSYCSHVSYLVIWVWERKFQPIVIGYHTLCSLSLHFALTENLSIYFQNSTEKNHKSEILYGVSIKQISSFLVHMYLLVGTCFVFYVGRHFWQMCKCAPFKKNTYVSNHQWPVGEINIGFDNTNLGNFVLCFKLGAIFKTPMLAIINWQLVLTL